LPGTEIVDGDGLPPVVALNDEFTNDSTPDLSGTINDPNATIVVTVNGIDYPAVNNGNGTWTLADNVLPVLGEGPHTVTVTATDLAGNVGTDRQSIRLHRMRQTLIQSMRLIRLQEQQNLVRQ